MIRTQRLRPLPDVKEENYTFNNEITLPNMEIDYIEKIVRLGSKK